MRKICVVIGSRANYISIKSAMKVIQKHSELKLQVVVGTSALLDRYGEIVDTVESDGFEIDARVYTLIEGETLATMAKSTGLGLLELPTVFERLQPDIVITVGDRFETMATALAAAYMNIALAQTMGGELSGTIDESIRHAITKLAHIHFPASRAAAERIIKLGERSEDVHMVGCPRIDLVTRILEQERVKSRLGSHTFAEGVGAMFDLNNPFLLVSQHPVTTEYGHGEEQIRETFMAVQEVGLPAVMLWPNADAGSEDISRGMRKFRETYPHSKIHFFKDLPIEDYISMMYHCVCLLGNSSSGIREGAFIGTPVVNIGTRQTGRERGANVIDVDCKRDEIANAIYRQQEHGRYKSEPIYGDGHAGERIADVLGICPIHLQKRITY